MRSTTTTPAWAAKGPGRTRLRPAPPTTGWKITAVDGTFGIRPIRHLSIAASAGYLFNVGPGTDSRYASTETVYTPAQAPGIDVQSNFSRTGGYVQYDWRDNLGGPRRGGNYFAQFSDYRDRSFGLSNFRRLDLEAQQFVSVLNQRRVFAVRAKSMVTFRDDNRPLPFYMQPSLGGAEDLSGYRPFRFHDDNLFVMNAEYRWEVVSARYGCIRRCREGFHA